ncbi:MAG: hypothetical protein BGP10_04600 [Rhodanobacter sp. 68-29]|nr:hypothetical protein [Rhodanobacter sp.]OJY61787.1 MAG: hypothetical protein BGP10_04600 [Rhodanobacter sp. 68-29]
MDSSLTAVARAKRLAMIRAAAQPEPPEAAVFVPRPTGKPRGSTPSVVPRYDGRHRALPNSNFAVLRGGR